MPASRNVPPDVARARSSLGRKIQLDAPPEEIKAARDELAEANAKAAIKRIVDSWPSLTPAQRERLALLLHPGNGGGNG
jgi:hypothetical protein